MAGTELAKAYVQIIPSADGIKGKLTSALSSEASSAGDSAGKMVGNSLASKLKSVIAVAGIGTALKSTLSEGANLQQSLGGIETLFKDSADKVIENAKNAYKTAGLSANDYMESVTSFSASLLQGLAGDTNRAAAVADMALTDMSDNANKMGTSMELIQNAYQGFAKQNYTMLDNLKLGYGGTKTEMERLLADATKLSGVEYNMDNLADVYEAIHVIQEEMGIAGTTAEEAASTFSGAFASMKSALSNVLGSITLGEDIKPAMDTLLSSVSTFLFDNLFPMVGNIFTGLVDYIVDTAVNTDWNAVISQVLTRIRGFLQSGITTYFGADTWQVMSETATTSFQKLWDVCNTAWTTIGKPVWESIQFAIGEMQGLFAQYMPEIMSFFQEAIVGMQDTWENHLKPVFEAIGKFLNDNLKPAFEFVFETIIKPLVDNVFRFIIRLWNDTLKPVFDGICDFITGVFTGDWKKMGDGIMGILTGLWDGIVNIFSSVGSFLSDSFGKIKDYASESWSEVAENTKKAWSVVKRVASEKMSETKAAIEKHGGGIKGFFGAMGETVQKNWTNTFTKMNEVSGGKLGEMLSSARSKLTDIKNAFSEKLNAAREAVGNAIGKIKDFFKFEWSLPDLKMPHFSISGSFSLNPPSVPSFGIDWYAKAMNDPMIMNSPTAFGINSLGQIMAGGERGSEVVSGTDTLMNLISEAVAAKNARLEEILLKILAFIMEYMPQMANMKMVTDTGALIGELAPGMDDALGHIAYLKEKGVL